MISAPCAYYRAAEAVAGMSTRMVRLGFAVRVGRSTECSGSCGICSSSVPSRSARVVRRGLAMFWNIIVVFTVVLDPVVRRCLAVACIL